MKSKAPLSLMEQMVMLAVFALAAALCLQAFVKSDAISRRSQARDRAVVLSQTAAEVLQHYSGDLDETARYLGCTAGAEELHVQYDEDWNVVEGGAYHLYIRYERSDIPGCGLAVVRVIEGSGEWDEKNTLVELPVAWQEVLP
ncbi:MAG: hypothetical protein HFF50_08640 [Lawsonibacter sp.]|nr:hypothetical protein [Lawsonibacter sp.]